MKIICIWSFSSPFRHSPWKAVSDDKNTTYMIRLCDGLKTTDGTHDCHSNTRICMTRKNDPKFPKPMSTGNKTDTGKPHNGKHNDTGEVWFLAAGDTCPDDPTENLTSIINFKCGKTMVGILIVKALKASSSKCLSFC